MSVRVELDERELRLVCGLLEAWGESLGMDARVAFANEEVPGEIVQQLEERLAELHELRGRLEASL